MYKTQKNHIRCYKQTYRLLRILCHLSKNLYNYALYHVRQYYFENHKRLAYERVYHIVKHCLNNQIGTVVVGEMKNIKQEIELGKVSNQNFVSIPHEKFKRKLEAKCRFYGVGYVEVDESYTSQMCSKCGIVKKSNRKYRGLYVCRECGYVANADINGAINILKKVAGESALVQIVSSGYVNHPVRIRVA
ncbi:transposase, IS605 OrfB family [Caldicellulosiruptor hydrothermalis 108]|uniref:Transposase, IS605 OrfB family n=1 Tax=Caldicellulosiruptor hydrothermalis (strain DSM 18901 / VKM B-2411 / 108) TaxID=632292 RepID=E4Q7I8_CALH1|nr:zinc ribbon domain-containing protein [Caldicellulosiruptor hydrothermalis]ADQ07833.1 transposase, IS605 OrfB family [Caldicellulosiruptor hydrothermalis 108]